MDKKRKIILISIVSGVLLISLLLILLIMNGNEKTYTVTFNSNGGTTINSQEVKEGETVKKVDDPTKQGYMFVEWQLNGKTYDFSSKVMKNITLDAIWFEKKEGVDTYIVKFNTNEGSTIPNQIVEKGNKIIKPNDPTKEGYIFKDWLLDGNIFDFDSLIDRDIELKAQWDKKSYIVTFNSNGGSAVEKQIVKDGDKVSKPSNPTKKDYIFVEWQLNGKTYNFNSKITKDIELKAVWKKANTEQVQNNQSTQQTQPTTPTTPQPTPQSILYGDVNGDSNVNNDDVILLTRYYDDLVTFSSKQEENADVNGDGYIDNLDISLIKGYIGGYFPNTLPNKKITNYVIYGDTLNSGIYDITEDAMAFSVVEQYLNGNTNALEGQCLKNADVNADGNVNYIDKTIMFWAINGYFEGQVPSFVPLRNYTFYGDVNNDGLANENDKIVLSNYLNNGVALSTQGRKNADVNDDGIINSTDYDILSNALTNDIFDANIPEIEPLS